MVSYKASQHGKNQITQARKTKGWSLDDSRWLLEASQVLEPNKNWSEIDPDYADYFAEGISVGTWKRFLQGQAIRPKAFKAFCQVLNLNWREIYDNELGNENSLKESFYVERTPYKERCQQEIIKPGALIRIKAPQKMGKTCLLEKLLNYALKKGYRIVKLDLHLADSSVLADLKTFLQWVCLYVSDNLELENKLNEYWHDLYGLNKNCTRYFQKYLLSVNDTPLVLAFDNFDLLFEAAVIFRDFCRLLRGWYEMAKQDDFIGQIWKKLRLIVVHSTEIYRFFDVNCSLDINFSPFNVGLDVELSPFSLYQVESLAQQYDLQFDQHALTLIIDLLDGHPYLIQKAFTYLKEHSCSLDHFLALAPTESGPLSDHLLRQLLQLKQIPELEAAFKKIVMADVPLSLDSELTFKLHSLGLVKLQENNCLPSCQLYRQYFSVRLKTF